MQSIEPLDRARIEQRLAEVGGRHGVVIHLARITGRRWSYVAGARGSALPLGMATRLPLADNWGAIVYSEQPLTDARSAATRDAVARCLKLAVPTHGVGP